MNIASKEQGKIITSELHRSFMGASLDRTADILKKEFGCGFDTQEFFKRSIELNKEIMKDGIPLMKGARELLDYLHSQNIHTCIGTSTARTGTINLLIADNILDDFEEMVCGDEVEHGKPAPDIYLKCFKKFNVDKSEVLIFEDGQAGGEAALAAGMRLVLVPDLAYLSEDLKNKAFKVIEDLSKIIDVIKEENERATSV